MATGSMGRALFQISETDVKAIYTFLQAVLLPVAEHMEHDSPAPHPASEAS